jgi:hypothetical protein
MEQKTLSEIQASTIIMALLFLDARAALESPMRIVKIEPVGINQQQAGIHVDFFASTSSKGGKPIMDRYGLYISYYDRQRNSNPEYIELTQFVYGKPQREALGSIGYVVDKLREYKIW